MPVQRFDHQVGDMALIQVEQQEQPFFRIEGILSKCFNSALINVVDVGDVVTLSATRVFDFLFLVVPQENDFTGLLVDVIRVGEIVECVDLGPNRCAVPCERCDQDAFHLLGGFTIA